MLNILTKRVTYEARGSCGTESAESGSSVHVLCHAVYMFIMISYSIKFGNGDEVYFYHIL